MPGFAHPPADLLPHAAPMVLLDEVLAWGDETVRASVRVAPDQPFFIPGQGIPAHVGIEWMAQACGLYAGMEALTCGEPVRLGFLLGSRHYHAIRSWFAEGEVLVVSARMIYREDGLAAFDCVIETAEEQLASARLTVYQPDDPAPVRTDDEAR
jgi:predicted hotdog family 3-hydroxylacyl-ACP dehydratase